MTIEVLLLEGYNHISTTAKVLYASGRNDEMLICNDGNLHYLMSDTGRTIRNTDDFEEPVETITFEIVAEV